MPKLNLRLDEPVMIINTGSAELDYKTGTNLGKSSEHATVDFYMILLNVPTKTHRAVNMIESCLIRPKENIDRTLYV